MTQPQTNSPQPDSLTKARRMVRRARLMQRFATSQTETADERHEREQSACLRAQQL